MSPEDLGPYLLGQLGPEEAAAVAELVEACPSCAAEVQRLLPVVRGLGRAGAPLDEEPPAAPDPALDRVLAMVRDERKERRRRRHRRVGLVAAALTLVFATAVGAVVLSVRDDDAGGGGREVTLTSGSSAAGSVEVWERGWGTALSLEVRGLTPGRPYGAWLADRNGKRVPAGTFRPTADGSARLDLSASLSLPDAAVVGVTVIRWRRRLACRSADARRPLAGQWDQSWTGPPMDRISHRLRADSDDALCCDGAGLAHAYHQLLACRPGWN